MPDIPIKPSGPRPTGSAPSSVTQQAGAESSKEKSRLERISDQFKKIEIPGLLKALKMAITHRGSTALPKSIAHSETKPQDPLEQAMVGHFIDERPLGEPLPAGEERFAPKSEPQCYDMLEKRLAPYTEPRSVPAPDLKRVVYRGLYKKDGGSDEVYLFGDVVVQKGEKSKTEKMSRIPVPGEARERVLKSKAAPGEPIDDEILNALRQKETVSYLALSHKIVRPDRVKDSEVAQAELKRESRPKHEKSDRGRFDFSVRAEGMAARMTGPVGASALPRTPEGAPATQVKSARLLWILIAAAALLLFIAYRFAAS